MGAIRAGQPLKTLLAILAAVFTADVTIMAFLGIFDLNLSSYIAIESVILSAILTPVLYFFIHVPLSKDIRQKLSIQGDLEQAQKTIEDYAGNLEKLVEEKVGEVLRAEEALRESEGKFRAISEKSHVCVYIIQDGKFVYVNPRIAEMLGVTPDELPAGNPDDFVHPDDRPIVREQIRKGISGEADAVNYEFRGLNRNGEIIYIEAYGSRMIYKGRPAMAGMLIDMTARKKAEEQLRAKEALLSESQKIAHLGSWRVDAATGRIAWTDETYRIYGVSPDAFDLNLESFYGLIHPDDRTAMREWVRACAAGEHPGVLEFRTVRPDGAVRILSGRGEVEYDANNKPLFLTGTAQDITEIKEAEESVRRSGQDWKNTFDSITDMITVHDAEYNIIRSNKAAEEILGLSFLGGKSCKKCFEYYHGTGAPPEGCPSCACLITKQSEIFELFEPHLNKHLEIRAIPRLDSAGNIEGLIHVVRDITEKKESTDKILRLNRLYSMLSGINEMIVRTENNENLIKDACLISVETGLFRMVWAGILDNETQFVKPVAISGFDDGYLNTIRISASPDMPEGKGPTGTALREGHPVICNDIETAEYMGPWREEALKRGFRASAAFPLKSSGKAFGAINFYAEKPGHFDGDEVRLLDEVANDISYAIESLGREKLRKEAEGKLKEKVGELEKFYEMAVGRELKMKELKKEIERLRAELAKAEG